MKLKKKFLMGIFSLTLTIAAALPLTSAANSVQAARVRQTSTITLTPGTSTATVPLANRRGHSLNGQKLKKGISIKAYGPARIIKLRYPAHIFPLAHFKKQYFVSLGDGGYVKQSVMDLASHNRLKITRTAYVYNRKAQRLRTYRGRRAVLPKNSYIKYAGKTEFTIPQAFFNIGRGRYLAARYVAQVNNKPLLTLNQNTYLYNGHGKRRGKKKLMRGQAITTNSQVRPATAKDQYYFYQSTESKNTAKSAFVVKKMKGQSYLSVGRSSYIKIANVRTANGMILFTKGPITVTLTNNSDNSLYNSSFKEIGRNLRAGTKVTLDKVMIDYSLSDPQLYFRIKGSQNLLYWGDYGEYPGAGRTADFDPDYNDPYAFWFKQFME